MDFLAIVKIKRLLKTRNNSNKTPKNIDPEKILVGCKRSQDVILQKTQFKLRLGYLKR